MSSLIDRIANKNINENKINKRVANYSLTSVKEKKSPKLI